MSEDMNHNETAFWNFIELQTAAKEDIFKIADEKALEEFRIKYFGRKGLITRIYASLATLTKEEKPSVGKGANEFKKCVTGLIEEKRAQLETAIRQRGSSDQWDVTIPGGSVPQGHKHVLTQIIDEICGLFEGLGFAMYEGPEIESEFYNFTALNIPVDHPSRDAFDTFYVETPDPQNTGRNLLLRSHTSPGQIRIMQAVKPPTAVIVPGRVYRPDAVDASHSFMFHQIEGLLVDEGVRFSDLKGLLAVFCERFFGEKIQMRFRPHFFPFTEPSAEVDIVCYICGGKGCSVCGRKGWLEILGCGMVHPKVFEAVNYPRKYNGLAFGMGVERMAMLKHGIHDIRIFFENDMRFLRQF
jgi:phenylalanyl-tRNA synthetase alpha chain